MSSKPYQPDTQAGSHERGDGERPRRPQNRTGRPDSPHRRSGPPDRSPQGAANALIELDKDLMKLLVRRSTLVSRVRGGRDHAGNPAAIQAEKSVRVAWEAGALSFSKDPRFVRDLFALMQDLKILTKEQAEKSANYSLSPSTRPVEGSLTGPSSTRTVQMRLVLAALLGKPLALNNVLYSSALRDCIKLYEQAGVTLADSRPGHGLTGINLAEATPPNLAEKTLFAGDDLFSLYLTIFMVLSKPGIYRLAGGPRLKSADLTPLRRCLPLFGARLGTIIPNSTGLPANVEVSGEIPPVVTLPEDLPFEALCALLLAPPVWGVPVTLNLAALPAAAATAALGEVRPLHRDTGTDLETNGPTLVYTPAQLTLAERPAIPMEPAAAAYLLAFPAFAGGSLTLTGAWPEHMPAAREAVRLLAWAGLDVEQKPDGITVKVSEQTYTPPLQLNDLSTELGPLYVALSALRTARGQAAASQEPVLFAQDETDQLLAQDLCGRIGFSWTENGPLKLSNEEREDTGDQAAWTAPDAFWGMAFALCAWLRPGLLLGNPAVVTDTLPTFWGIYNSLPSPSDPAKAPKRDIKEPSNDKPARRRIIAD